MSWQILILTSVVFFSVATILQKVLLRDEKSDAVAYSIFFEFLTGILITSFGLLFGDMSFGNLIPLIPNIIVLTVLYGLGNILVFKGLQLIEASKFTVIFSSKAIFTILASGLMLGETFNIKQWVGASFIFLGVILVSLKSAKIQFTRNEIVALLAAICIGFANTNDRVMLKSLKLYPYLFFSFLAPATLALIFNTKSIPNMKVFLKKSLFLKMFFMCVMFAIASVTFFSSLQVAPNSSQVVTIFLTSVVVTVILAIVFLKEREHIGQKLLGTLASFVGLLLVS